MTDEQRLQATTEMLILVRDNLFRGMSKSIQKLQAQSINEFLQLPNYTESPQRQWVGLTPEEILDLFDRNNVYGSKWIEFARTVEAKLKERNGY